MKKIKIVSLPTDKVRQLQAGGIDANGLKPELLVEGGGPCRHCLQPIELSEKKLLLSYRPFSSLNPYSETGPIFLHAKHCSAYEEMDVLPKMLLNWGDSPLIVRGYSQNERIQYGSSLVIPSEKLEKHCYQLLMHKDVAFLHVRAGSTNCYQFRVEFA